MVLGPVARLCRSDRDPTVMDVELRIHERAARARPMMSRFRAWVDDEQLQLLPRVPIGKAAARAQDPRPLLFRFV